MNGPDGQLLPAERQFLRNSVTKRIPKLVLEVGTWYGGGSTLAIAESLGPDGVLMTCDPSKECFEYAKELHNGNKMVHCFNCTGMDLICELQHRGWFPDLVFFDGAEDPEITFYEFIKLQEITMEGAIFMAHDFDPPSRKCMIIRPYLENCSRWKMLRCLTNPDSVGMCKYRRVKE